MKNTSDYKKVNAKRVLGTKGQLVFDENYTVAYVVFGNALHVSSSDFKEYKYLDTDKALRVIGR